MYEQFYGLKERPFSITPDPRFVYLSRHHEDALAHLLYGIGRGGGGGFVQLTGEVGTGKTTLCRLLMEQVPQRTRVALILNPMLTPAELLRSICRELEIDLGGSDGSQQDLIERLNRYLLDAHAAGERVVLIIDEAQNMSREALEQVRLLTNLETSTEKLLQILLLGQPELRTVLARPSLRQLAQRITARYHLEPLDRAATAAYVRHRLAVAGAPRCPFRPLALRTLYRVSGGVPRLINIIADRALMGGYARESEQIGPRLVRAAAAEVYGAGAGGMPARVRGMIAGAAVVAVLAGSGGLAWILGTGKSVESADVDSLVLPVQELRPAWQDIISRADAGMAWREVAALWPGVRASQVAAACDGETGTGLACQAGKGGWAYLRELGMPVVLRLDDPRGGHVLLVGLEGESVVLRLQGQDFRIPASQAERRWKGDFLAVWPDDGRVFRTGDRGPEVERFKRLAAAVPDLPWDGPVDELYSLAFSQWVRRFQRYHGVADDGMIGPVTRLHLKVPRLDGPQLLARNLDLEH